MSARVTNAVDANSLKDWSDKQNERFAPIGKDT